MQAQTELARLFYAEMLSGNRLIFVCVYDGQFIGEGSLVFNKHGPDYTIPGKRIYLSRLLVKEAFRRQGIGSAIVDFLIAYGKTLGYREFSIGVNLENSAALQLYRSKGFTETVYRGSDQGGEFLKLLKRCSA